MQAVNSPVFNGTFESLYDKYSPMLFSIAIAISVDEEEAEKILMSAFEKVHDRNLCEHDPVCLCPTLIKLIIETAREHFNGRLANNFKLKQFENAPLLHALLCESITIEDYCQENKITQPEVAKKIRLEFNSIR